MPRISKLRIQQNRKRVNLYLDGEYATSLDLETVARKQLKVGQDLTLREFETLRNTHNEEKLLAKSANMLSYRPRSERELRMFLQRKWTSKIDKEEYGFLIEKVIQKLKQKKALDDREFAKWWVEQRTAFRPKGKIMIRSELVQKGIDRGIIDRELEALDEDELAERIVQKKLRTSKTLDEKARHRLIAVLQRRGFSWQTIKRVVDERERKE